SSPHRYLSTHTLPPAPPFFPYTPLFRSETISAESESDPPLSLAAYTRKLRMLFMEATAQLRALDPGQPPLRIETAEDHELYAALDRKSTRLNSSHVKISYAVFCLKKKKT